MPPMEGLRVVRSRIHGYGVIATRPFREGEVISTIDGIMYRSHERTDDRGTLWLDDDRYLDILDQMRWLNHSCDPNIWIDAGVREDGTPWAHVIALRAIEPSEELTLDYALEVAEAEPCGWGGPSCGGCMVDPQSAAAPAPPAPRRVAARRSGR
jgi:SET domain-containing protein